MSVQVHSAPSSTPSSVHTPARRMALSAHLVWLPLLTVLDILEITGRELALVSALFFISLAVINAFLILIQAMNVTPFQLGAPILVALGAFAMLLGYSGMRSWLGSKG